MIRKFTLFTSPKKETWEVNDALITTGGVHSSINIVPCPVLAQKCHQLENRDVIFLRGTFKTWPCGMVWKKNALYWQSRDILDKVFLSCQTHIGLNTYCEIPKCLRRIFKFWLSWPCWGAILGQELCLGHLRSRFAQTVRIITNNISHFADMSVYTHVLYSVALMWHDNASGYIKAVLCKTLGFAVNVIAVEFCTCIAVFRSVKLNYKAYCMIGACRCVVFFM